MELFSTRWDRTGARAAREAEIKHKKTWKERVKRRERRPQIDFGSLVPFTNISGLILSGSEEVKASFSEPRKTPRCWTTTD
ncbi:hypothetical protein ColTof4_13812 [Colletotrichum tofieldiae]|nr:hypothetical protein ColTof4_13812 [Colletotrichum tofieldiae]